MTCQRLEGLPVWQSAAELYEATEDLVENEGFQATGAFRDQQDRAALSVSNNTAEGFERSTANEWLASLYIARGSAGEGHSFPARKLRRAQKSPWSDDLKSQLSDLKSLAESGSRQLRAQADALQNCDMNAQRRLTAKFRQKAEQKKRAAAFQEELLHKLPPDHPPRRQAEERGLI